LLFVVVVLCTLVLLLVWEAWTFFKDNSRSRAPPGFYNKKLVIKSNSRKDVLEFAQIKVDRGRRRTFYNRLPLVDTPRRPPDQEIIDIEENEDVKRLLTAADDTDPTEEYWDEFGDPYNGEEHPAFVIPPEEDDDYSDEEEEEVVEEEEHPSTEAKI
jgi:hypothetical protein